VLSSNVHSEVDLLKAKIKNTEKQIKAINKSTQKLSKKQHIDPWWDALIFWIEHLLKNTQIKAIKNEPRTISRFFVAGLLPETLNKQQWQTNYHVKSKSNRVNWVHGNEQ